MATGAIAEPIAGLGGISQSLNPFGDEGSAAAFVESLREKLTYMPKTQEGLESLQKISDFMAPLTDKIKEGEDYLGDEGAKISPAMAALNVASPTAILSAIGAGPVTRALRAAKKPGNVAKALKESAPTVGAMKEEARKVYKKIDDSGAVVNSPRISRLVDETKSLVEKEGFDVDLHPKVAATLKRLEQIKDTSQPVGKIDTLRKIAKSAASSIDSSEKRLGVKVINKIDDMMENLKPSDFSGGSSEIGNLYKDARQLWSRSKKSELIKEAFTKADLQATGIENGLRIQFRQIINNKKKRQGFSSDEIRAMEKVVKGGTIENISKQVGRLAFGEGAASNVLGGLSGVAAGSLLGGPVGAVLVPGIGHLSRSLAQKLTRKNSELAEAIVRAGKDGGKLVSEYIAKIPVKQQKPGELAELLLRPEVNLNVLREQVSRMRPTKRKLVRDALIYAEVMQGIRDQSSE